MNAFLANLYLRAITVRDREEGQAMAEYGIILALIAVVCVLAIGFLGTHSQRHVRQRQGRVLGSAIAGSRPSEWATYYRLPSASRTTEMRTRVFYRSEHTGNEKGQAMVEFAIVAPILLVLVFGIIEFGIAFNHSSDGHRCRAGRGATGGRQPDAAREAQAPRRGNRGTGAVGGQGSLSDAGDPTALVVTVTSTFAQGSDVTVKATYPYTISLLGLPIKQGLFTSETTERVE